MERARLAEAGRAPLFQVMKHRLYGGGRAELTGEQLNPINAWKMVRRRAKAAGITTEVCNHTFRGTGITAYLENGGTLEKARPMATTGDRSTQHSRPNRCSAEVGSSVPINRLRFTRIR